MPKNDTTPPTIGVLLIDDFSLMSYAAAVEPLRAANLLSGRELYRWRHVAVRGDVAEASNGGRVVADLRVGDTERLDTLLVCAGGNPALFDDAATFGWLRALARKGVRLGGISGGPYLLAKAGLLNGYRCTVHWEHLPALAEAYPDLQLQRTLYELDRDRLTCAGGVAAMDMMVELIARDHGRALAAVVADWYLRSEIRAGGAAQRMPLRERTGVSDTRLLRALAYMEAHVEEPASLSTLAAIAGVSPRQLERLFRRLLGEAPAARYLQIRLDRAHVLLRQTTMTTIEAAVACGFVNGSHFSRTYKARFGAPPSRDRDPTVGYLGPIIADGRRATCAERR
ncbi:MAG: GlxA family transcriptional regulator [Caulobacteraceae bacterium]